LRSALERRRNLGGPVQRRRLTADGPLISDIAIAGEYESSGLRDANVSPSIPGAATSTAAASLVWMCVVQASAQDLFIVAPSGREKVLHEYAGGIFSGGSCQPAPRPSARIDAPLSHGEVKTQAFDSAVTVRVRRDDARIADAVRCDGVPLHSIRIVYRSEAGFHGIDKVGIEVTTRGHDASYDVITIFVQ
jgi:hypothetical protein